jgi:hypothetical protein
MQRRRFQQLLRPAKQICPARLLGSRLRGFEPAVTMLAHYLSAKVLNIDL